MRIDSIYHEDHYNQINRILKSFYGVSRVYVYVCGLVEQLDDTLTVSFLMNNIIYHGKLSKELLLIAICSIIIM